MLLNYYRDGNDSVGYHTDADDGVGLNPIVPSLSLGATRRFLLKHVRTKELLTFDLTHGSLLIMAGTTQHHWVHSVPKTKANVGERINLTLRNITPSDAKGRLTMEKNEYLRSGRGGTGAMRGGTAAGQGQEARGRPTGRLPSLAMGGIPRRPEDSADYAPAPSAGPPAVRPSITASPAGSGRRSWCRPTPTSSTRAAATPSR